jgi:hypothetical protein
VGPGGILIDPESPIENWVKAVKMLWGDEAIYTQLSTAALEHSARPALKWNSQVLMWENIFTEAVSRGLIFPGSAVKSL